MCSYTYLLFWTCNGKLINNVIISEHGQVCNTACGYSMGMMQWSPDLAVNEVESEILLASKRVFDPRSSVPNPEQSSMIARHRGFQWDQGPVTSLADLPEPSCGQKPVFCSISGFFQKKKKNGIEIEKWYFKISKLGFHFFSFGGISCLYSCCATYQMGRLAHHQGSIFTEYKLIIPIPARLRVCAFCFLFPVKLK
jgi:hypothetical protein